MHKSEYKKKKGLRIRTLSGVTPPERLCRRAARVQIPSVYPTAEPEKSTTEIFRSKAPFIPATVPVLVYCHIL